MSEVLCCEHIRDVNSPSSNPSDPTGKSNDDDDDDVDDDDDDDGGGDVDADDDGDGALYQNAF